MKGRNCSYTNKVTFYTLKEADKRAEEINREEGKELMRAYNCSWCGQFHLSTMDKDEFDKIQEIRRKKNSKMRYLEAKHWEQKLK